MGSAPRTSRTAALVSTLSLVLQSVASAASPASAGQDTGGAQAGPTDRPRVRTALMPLHLTGPIPPTDGEALTTRLRDALERGRFALVDTPPDAPTRACDTPKCRQQLASDSHVTHLVGASVDLDERDYTIAVELFDGRTGETLAHATTGCEICGISDAGELIAAEAASLSHKLEAMTRGPPSLLVESQPGGAEVRIDGEVSGTTPMQTPLTPGKHRVRISKQGFIVLERELTFVEGVTESVRVDLERNPTRLPGRPWGWASLGVGIASLGVAVGFAAIRNRPYQVAGACAGANIDDDGDCRRLWSTEWHALAFAAVGATLTTLGAAILAAKPGRERGRKARGSRRARVEVGPGQVTVHGRF